MRPNNIIYLVKDIFYFIIYLFLNGNNFYKIKMKFLSELDFSLKKKEK
jgi:hypothetical protein